MKKFCSVVFAFMLMFSLSQAASAKNSTQDTAVSTVDAYYNDLAQKNFEAIASLISDQSSWNPQDAVMFLSDMFYENQINIVDYKIKKIQVDPNNPNYVDVSVKLVETVSGDKSISTEQVTLNQDADGVWKIVDATVLKQQKK